MPLDAARRHWVITGIVVIGSLAGAIYVGVTRHPTYTANSQMNVGQVGVPSAVSGSYVQAVQSLTITYSRAAESPLVLGPIARRMNVSTQGLSSRVSATPVPVSSIVSITADGPTGPEAVRLANAVAAQLIVFSGTLQRASPANKALVGKIAGSTARQSAAIRRLGEVERLYETDPSTQNGRRLDDARARVGAIRVHVRTLIASLQQLQESGSAGPALTVISPALSADSDKKSVLERLVAVALIAGLSVGTLIAVAMDAIRRRTVHAEAK